MNAHSEEEQNVRIHKHLMIKGGCPRRGKRTKQNQYFLTRVFLVRECCLEKTCGNPEETAAIQPENQSCSTGHTPQFQVVIAMRVADHFHWLGST